MSGDAISGSFLGVKTCELFLCFGAIVFMRHYHNVFLLFLHYATDEFYSLLHRG